MLTVQGLNAGYGRLQVLFDVDAVASSGLITAVVGPNGSGKSTLIKSIFGLTRIFSGKITMDGVDITGLPPHIVARHGIAYLPQVENVFSNLKVRENLMMSAYLMDEASAREKTKRLLAMFPVLQSLADRRAGTMSGGERQMLAMAMALMREPKLIMFDEPTGNLAPRIALQIFETIKRLRDELGTTIVLAEQNAKKAMEISDKAILLVSGRPVYEGEAQRLLAHEELSKLYLGIR